MADGILPVIQRKNPEKEFEILKQIGSGTYGEVYKVSLDSSCPHDVLSFLACDLHVACTCVNVTA